MERGRGRALCCSPRIRVGGSAPESQERLALLLVTMGQHVEPLMVPALVLPCCSPGPCPLTFAWPVQGPSQARWPRVMQRARAWHPSFAQGPQELCADPLTPGASSLQWGCSALRGIGQHISLPASRQAGHGVAAPSAGFHPAPGAGKGFGGLCRGRRPDLIKYALLRAGGWVAAWNLPACRTGHGSRVRAALLPVQCHPARGRLSGDPGGTDSPCQSPPMALHLALTVRGRTFLFKD